MIKHFAMLNLRMATTLQRVQASDGATKHKCMTNKMHHCTFNPYISRALKKYVKESFAKNIVKEKEKMCDPRHEKMSVHPSLLQWRVDRYFWR